MTMPDERLQADCSMLRLEYNSLSTLWDPLPACWSLNGKDTISCACHCTLHISAATEVNVVCQVRERMKQTHGKPEQREWDFAAQANAMVVKDAESYYRNMFFKGVLPLDTGICNVPSQTKHQLTSPRSMAL